MNENLRKLIDLALEWKKYSLAVNEWSSTTYFEDEPESVRCYFAKASDHTDVTFTFAGETVGVAFFKIPEITMKSTDFDLLLKNVTRYFSDRLKGMPAPQNKEKSEKAVRKEYLLNELKKLE